MVRAHGFKQGWGAIGASVAVILGLVAFGASPSMAAPAEDCAEPFPVADLTPGQAVNGLTVQPVIGNVATYTEPAPFGGTYVDVVKDGIAPGLDMLLFEFTSPEIDRVQGIWAGMSGSPVYAANGQLIGAVSYGLSTGPSHLAGVTPFEEMDDYVSAATATRVAVSAKTASRVAARTDTSKEELSGGLSRLPLPKTISGAPQRALTRAGDARRWSKSGFSAGGSASSSSGPDADTIVAGGNLGAAVAWGDITVGGVGTATSVCNGKVVGFGHPMLFAGKTTEALLPASAVRIADDPTLSPFKVANFGEPVGTITDDRMAGITGSFGPTPPAFMVREDLTYGSRHRAGTSKVSLKGWDPDVTFYQQYANHERVLDGTIPGNEGRSWTIAGRDAKGKPFTLALRNRYTSDSDITDTVAWDVADQVYVLSSLKGVTLDSVDIRGVVTDDTTTYQVNRVQQYRAGAWHNIRPDRPIFGHAGQVVNVRTVLSGESGQRAVRSRVTIPASAKGTTGTYTIGGLRKPTDDDEFFDEEEYPSGTLPEVLAFYRKQRSNDQLYGALRLRGRTVTFTTSPVDKIVYGSVRVPVRVAWR